MKLLLPGQAPLALRAVLRGPELASGDSDKWRDGRPFSSTQSSQVDYSVASLGVSPAVMARGVDRCRWNVARSLRTRRTSLGSTRECEGLASVSHTLTQSALALLAAQAAAVAAPQVLDTPAPSPVSHDYSDLSARFVAHLAPGSTPGPCCTSAAPGAMVIRAWRVVNEGSRRWPPGTALAYVGCRPESAWGGEGGAPAPAAGGVPVPCAAPGSFVDIALPLTAPPLPGRYVAYFRLQAPEPGQGSASSGGQKRFGHQLRADLLVECEFPPSR